MDECSGRTRQVGHVMYYPVTIMWSSYSGCPEAVKLLVGNKCDLPAEVDLSHAAVSDYISLVLFTIAGAGYRQIQLYSYSNLISLCVSLQRYAELHDMDFIESSAKSNMNVKEAFLKLAKDICELKAQQAPPTFPTYDANPSLSLTRDTQPISKEVSGCRC